MARWLADCPVLVLFHENDNYRYDNVMPSYPTVYTMYM